MSALVFSPKAGVFAELAEPTKSAEVYLEGGVPTWPGELDIAPDAAYSAIRSSKDGVWAIAPAG